MITIRIVRATAKSISPKKLLRPYVRVLHASKRYSCTWRTTYNRGREQTLSRFSCSIGSSRGEHCFFFFSMGNTRNVRSRVLLLEICIGCAHVPRTDRKAVRSCRRNRAHQPCPEKPLNSSTWSILLLLPPVGRMIVRAAYHTYYTGKSAWWQMITSITRYYDILCPGLLCVATAGGGRCWLKYYRKSSRRLVRIRRSQPAARRPAVVAATLTMKHENRTTMVIIKYVIISRGWRGNATIVQKKILTTALGGERDTALRSVYSIT